MTRFIESVPRNSSSTPSPTSLSEFHTRLQPQLSPLSPTSNEAKVTGPVQSDSSRLMLSRRLRHASLRLSPTPPARSRARDNHHTRNSSSMSTPVPEPSQRAGQPQLPKFSKISPMISPSQFPMLSTTSPLSEAHDETQGYNIIPSLVTRKHKPDFEEISPSSGSIASTGISPSLMLQHSQLERRIDEAMNAFAHVRASDSILAKTADKRELSSSKSDELSPQENPISSRSRAASQCSREPDSRLSSHKSRSRRSASQPMPLTCSRQLLERHPNQLFAMQISSQWHDDRSTRMPSHTSLRVDPGQPAQRDYTLPGSILLPPTSEAASDNQTEVLERPPQDLTVGQSQTFHAVTDTEDREGTRVALSSVSESPRRSISRYDSPNIPDHGSSSDCMTTSMSIGPRRRRRESVVAPQDETTSDHCKSSPARLQQPVNRVTGNLGNTSGRSQGRSMNGTHTSRVPQTAQALLLANPPPKRTLDSVRNQVATEIAYRAVSKSSVVDGVRVAVTDASSAWSGPNDIPFIHLISSSFNASFVLSSTPYLFIITATSFSPGSTLTSGSKSENGSLIAAPAAGLLYITSSSCKIASRAVHLTCSKFIGRIISSSYTFSMPDVDTEKAGDVSLGLATKELEWMARIKELHFSSFDSDVIHSILITASRTPLDPAVPPPNSKSINVLLEEARAQLTRITPQQALTELVDTGMDVPTVLVDIRPQAQREEFGEILGALVVERNVLEWKFDPRCELRLAVADRYDLRVIVFCQEGYTSSLAARSLQQLGLLNATDIIGGYKAWKDAELPVKIKPRSVVFVPRSPVRVP